MNRLNASEARHLLITGKVQGVGYRWNMLHQASVEALACGDDESLAALIAWARHGPAGAQVSHVHVERIVITEAFGEGFKQQPTV